MFNYEWKEPSLPARGRASGMSAARRQAFDETARLLADAFDSGETRCAMKIGIPKGEFDGEAVFSRGPRKGAKKKPEDVSRQRHANFAARMRAALNRVNRVRERSGKMRLGLSVKPVGEHEVEFCAKEFTPRRRKGEL